MGRDASLDEFLGVDGDGDPEVGVDDGGTDRTDAGADAEADRELCSGTDTDPAPGEAADPVRPVVRWRPDGAACAACGASVERRWRDDGDLVCVDCKHW